MPEVKIVISAVNVKDRSVLNIVKRGVYAQTKSGIKQALTDGYADKYKKRSPNFDVTDVVLQPNFDNDLITRYFVSFKDKPLFVGRTKAQYTAEVTFKNV